MKTLFLIIVASLIALASEAQWSYKFLSQEKHFLYTSGDVIMGNQASGQISLNYVYNKKYTVNIGYAASTKSDAVLPNNILKSATELTPSYSTLPFSNSENIHLLVGRVFNLNQNGTFRLLLQGGPGLYSSRNPMFSVKSNTYDYEMQTEKSLCLVLNPKVELPLCCTIGISAGPMVMLNGQEQYIGAGIGIMYGIIGKD